MDGYTQIYAGGIRCGASCAVVTPFSGGEIDFDSLGRVIDHVLAGGVRSIVVCGTTGESATLTDAEQTAIVKYAVGRCAGRAQVLCGASSNSSVHAARRAARAIEAGADGVLCVTPYYNKASEDGMAAHYLLISDAVASVSTTAGIILYNVPSRTGSSLTFGVLDRLADRENIVGIKEASGDMRTVTGILARYGKRFAGASAAGDADGVHTGYPGRFAGASAAGDADGAHTGYPGRFAGASAEGDADGAAASYPGRFALWSGCDELNQPIMASGGVGCISVLANVFPAEVERLCRASLSGDHETARRISEAMRGAVDALFCEVNPIPVKAALADMGLCREEYRLPLCPLGEAKRRYVTETMRRYR